MLKYHEDLDTHLDPHEEPKCETEIILRTRSLRMPSTTGGGGSSPYAQGTVERAGTYK